MKLGSSSAAVRGVPVSRLAGTCQQISRGSLRTRYSFSQNILPLLYDTQNYITTFTAPWALF